MKNSKLSFLLRLLPLIIFLITFGSCEDEDMETPKSLFVNDVDNRRGWYGVGIASIVSKYVPQEEGCNKPNGVCSIALSMSPVSITSSSNLGYRLTSPNSNTLRYAFIKENSIDTASLKRIILSELPTEEKQYADEITEYMLSHFYVPKDLEFPTESSELILKLMKKRGDSVIAKSGEYKIEKNEESPYGYFDLKIEVQ